MALNLICTNFATQNTESAVDFHMPVLVMAEQIIHVVMAGEATYKHICICSGLPSLLEKYILMILSQLHISGFTCTSRFHITFTQIHTV